MTVSTGSLGALNELRAAAWLLEQGYQVFRAVSPSSPFDLAAYREGRFWRVEVKTLSVSVSTRVSVREGRRYQHYTVGYPANDEWDLLLLVDADGTVRQFEAPISLTEIRATLPLLPLLRGAEGGSAGLTPAPGPGVPGRS